MVNIPDGLRLYDEEVLGCDAGQRRRKADAFCMGTMAKKGQLWGNGNGKQVAVRNKYWSPIPGGGGVVYGYYDSAVNPDDYPDNPNLNVMEWIDMQPVFHAKGSNFASWDAVRPDPETATGIRCW